MKVLLAVPWLCWGMGTAVAGDIKSYSAPPSVEELKNVLIGNSAGGAGKKFRKLEFNDAKVAPSAPSSGSGAGGTVAMPIQFGFNSAEIDPESRAFVDTVGKLLQQEQALRLEIEGHTDAAGTETYNHDLSARRAAAVKKYLIDSHGIAPERLKSTGKGKMEPLVPGDPLNSCNRRVQFRVAG